MSLNPYDPFRHLSNIRSDFEQFFPNFPSAFGNDFSVGGIRVDVHETANEVVATCDIPGIEKKEDIHIEIEKDTLKVSGTVNKTNETSEKNMHRQERFVGHFQRSISLPTPVASEGVKASYKNGVLEIRMPKLTHHEQKKIDIDFH